MNKVEQLKEAKHPLRVIDDIYRYAKDGYASIEPDDFTRFKWYGLYEQRPKGNGKFMMARESARRRSHYPADARARRHLARLRPRHRRYHHAAQTFQFHNFEIEEIPDILGRLDAVSIATAGACGDIARNVTGCPVAGTRA